MPIQGLFITHSLYLPISIEKHHSFSFVANNTSTYPVDGANSAQVKMNGIFFLHGRDFTTGRELSARTYESMVVDESSNILEKSKTRNLSS